MWKKAEDYRFIVKSHGRSKGTGKEKKLDSDLSSDLTEVAIKHEGENGVIVLVAGDADFIPPIMKALNHGWNVEIYMWSHAISHEIKRLSQKHSNQLRMFTLGEHLSKITFTEKEFSLKGHHEAAIKDSGVVLHLRQQKVDKDLERKIENISQWPFQYFWLVDRHDERKNDVVILYFKREGERKFDVTEFVKIFNKHCPLYSAQPYLQYAQQQDNEMRRLISTCTNVEAALGKETDKEITDEESSTVNEDEPFKLVEYNVKRRNQHLSEHCKYKFCCKRGNKCEYYHTSEEKMNLSEELKEKFFER